MNKLARRLLAGLLALTLLSGALPVFAQGGPGSGMPFPEGHNGVSVIVLKEDPAKPGSFVKAEGVMVAHAHPDRTDEVRRFLSDSEGRVALTDVADGLTVVYLELNQWNEVEGYAFPEGHTLDDQAFYLQLDRNRREAEISFRLKLQQAPPEGEPATGGIRLQKAYYPYPFVDSPAHSTTLMSLMVFEGEAVQGAEFIVYRTDDRGEFLHYWNKDHGPVAQEAMATRYASDLNGRVLIDGLPPGPYMVREVTPLPGCGFPKEGTDFGPYGQWGSFQLEENTVLTKHAPVVNAPEGFAVTFQKLEKDPEYPGEVGGDGPPLPGRPVIGAKFVIYRLVDGQKEYLYYRTPLGLGGPALSAFTTDRAQAEVLVSGYYGGYSSAFLTPGHPSTFTAAALPAKASGSGLPIAYYLEEIEPAPGYLPADSPHVFTMKDAVQSNGWDYEGYIDLFNERKPGTVLIQKAAFPLQRIDPFGRMRHLAGAEFVLLQLEPLEEEEGQVQQRRFRVFRGTQGGAPLFSDWFTLSSDDLGEDPSYEEVAAFVLAHDPLRVSTVAPSGTAVFELGPELPPGLYTIMETKWPSGFAPADADHFSAAFLEQLRSQKWLEPHLPSLEPGRTFMHPGGAVNNSQFIYNLPLEDAFILDKADQSGKDRIQGAKFILHAIAQENIAEEGYISYVTAYEGYLAKPPQRGEPLELTQDREAAYRFETDADGRLIISGLPRSEGKWLHSYAAFEVEAPEGYALLVPDSYPMGTSTWKMLAMRPMPSSRPASR